MNPVWAASYPRARKPCGTQDLKAGLPSPNGDVATRPTDTNWRMGDHPPSIQILPGGLS